VNNTQSNRKNIMVPVFLKHSVVAMELIQVQF